MLLVLLVAFGVVALFIGVIMLAVHWNLTPRKGERVVKCQCFWHSMRHSWKHRFVQEGWRH